MLNYVLDASVLVSLFRGEREAEKIATILPVSCVTNFNFFETASVLLKMKIPEHSALEFLTLIQRDFGLHLLSASEELSYGFGSALSIIPVSWEYTDSAGKKKANNLGIHDRWCMAYALSNNLIAMTNDKAWLNVARKIQNLKVIYMREV